MQERRELPRYRHYRSLPGVLATALGYLLPMAPKVRVLPKWPEDVVSASHQQPSEQLVAVPGDALLRVVVSGLILARHKSRVGSYRPTVDEAHRIFEGHNERQGGECSDALHLSEESRLWVEFFGRCLELAIVLSYAGSKLCDGLKDGAEARLQELRYLASDLLVEALRRALGKPITEGLDREAHVVDEPGPGAHQGFARADQGKVRLGRLAPMLNGRKQL